MAKTTRKTLDFIGESKNARLLIPRIFASELQFQASVADIDQLNPAVDLAVGLGRVA